MLRLIFALTAVILIAPAYAQSPLPSPETLIDRALTRQEKPASKKTAKKSLKKSATKAGKKKESSKSTQERTLPADISKL